jgi:hypothetical protein
MRPDDAQPATTAQWVEHSEAWRYAHLDLAPTDAFRRMAIREHDELLHPPVAGAGPTRRWLSRFHNRKRRP